MTRKTYILLVYDNTQTDVLNRFLKHIIPKLIQLKIEYHICVFKNDHIPYSEGILFSYMYKILFNRYRTRLDDIKVVFQKVYMLPNEDLLEYYDPNKHCDKIINLEHTFMEKNNINKDSIGCFSIMLRHLKTLHIHTMHNNALPLLNVHHNTFRIYTEILSEAGITYDIPSSAIYSLVPGSTYIKYMSASGHLRQMYEKKIFYQNLYKNIDYVKKIGSNLTKFKMAFNYRNLLYPFGNVISDPVQSVSNVKWTFTDTKHPYTTSTSSNSRLTKYNVSLKNQWSEIREVLSFTYSHLYIDPLWSRYYNRKDIFSYQPSIPAFEIDTPLYYLAQHYSSYVIQSGYVRFLTICPVSTSHLSNNSLSYSSMIKRSLDNLFSNSLSKISFEHSVMYDTTHDFSKVRLRDDEYHFEWRQYSNLLKIKKMGKFNIIYNKSKCSTCTDNIMRTHNRERSYETVFLSMIVALTNLEIDGIFISVVEHSQFVQDCIIILNIYFDTIVFQKTPNSFRYSSDSYYICCKGFKGIAMKELHSLYELWETKKYKKIRFEFNSNFVDLMHKHKAFLKNIQNIHDYKYDITFNLKHILGKKTVNEQTKIKKSIRKAQVDFAYAFCKTYQIPMNKGGQSHNLKIETSSSSSKT